MYFLVVIFKVSVRGTTLVSSLFTNRGYSFDFPALVSALLRFETTVRPVDRRRDRIIVHIDCRSFRQDKCIHNTATAAHGGIEGLGSLTREWKVRITNTRIGIGSLERYREEIYTIWEAPSPLFV